MKIIDVSNISHVLLNPDAAKELFIQLLEIYLDGDKTEDIELNFKNVLTLSPDFWQAFVLLCIDSSQLTIDKLNSQIIFSGLFVKDITNFSNALDKFKNREEFSKENISRKLWEQYNIRQKEVWGDNPLIKSVVEKTIGAIEQALDKVPEIKKS